MMRNNFIKSIHQHRWGWLLLFTSSATLVCCALPILLVMLGLGAVSAAFFSTFPILVTLAKHKLVLFIVSGVLLSVGGWVLFKSNRHCPVDPVLAQQCEKAHRFNIIVWVLAVFIWLLGFIAAYLALPIMTAIGAF